MNIILEIEMPSIIYTKTALVKNKEIRLHI